MTTEHFKISLGVYMKTEEGIEVGVPGGEEEGWHGMDRDMINGESEEKTEVSSK